MPRFKLAWRRVGTGLTLTRARPRTRGNRQIRAGKHAVADLIDTKTSAIVNAETAGTFVLMLEFETGRVATMSASFATTPTRGTKIVVHEGHRSRSALRSIRCRRFATDQCRQILQLKHS